MHLIFLGSDESWYLRDLQRAAHGRHQITAAPFSTLRGVVDGEGLSVCSSATNLSAAHAVLVRTMPPGSLEQVVVRMDLLFHCELALRVPCELNVSWDAWAPTSSTPLDV